jgi:hypothetical protein
MAKLIALEGQHPKRIGNYVLYPLDGDIIIRTISGFTTEALLKAPHYEKCRQNATEFGKLSKTCKHLRYALHEHLPKANKLKVMNTFTKKMHQVLNCDSTSPKGTRTLSKALATPEGKALVWDYAFNPAVMVPLDYQTNDHQLQLATATLPIVPNANWLGCRVLRLAFDFDTFDHQLQASVWQLFAPPFATPTINCTIPQLNNPTGILFTLLELHPFVEEEGSYTPLLDDSSKMLVIVGCE